MGTQRKLVVRQRKGSEERSRFHKTNYEMNVHAAAHALLIDIPINIVALDTHVNHLQQQFDESRSLTVCGSVAKRPGVGLVNRRFSVQMPVEPF